LVINRTYIPNRGDLLWIDFSPQSGHEQAGIRPALCISPKQYNQKVYLAIICPITSVAKGYPYEVELPANLKTKGVVLSDQVKSLDWQKRTAEFIEKIPKSTVNEVLAKLHTLL
jgi:mRNA interferase MazF